MPGPGGFTDRLQRKIKEQLASQRVGYLLGAGSSYLDGQGYPLASELWESIADLIEDAPVRAEIEAKLDAGATGIEQALDLLDDGGAIEGTHRHQVTLATAKLFRPLEPSLDQHIGLVQRLSARGDRCLKIFSVNYDPLIERAAERAQIRIYDGFVGHEHAFFDPTIFDERVGHIRGTFRSRQFDETASPLCLLKLHGSVGWYECPATGIRRGGSSVDIPPDTKPLMIPPQRRKASETMTPPYSALWSAFRGALAQDRDPINRLVCVGYGFLDEHVNAVIEPALARSNFTLLVFARELSDDTWHRWSVKNNVIVVTEARCALYGDAGAGHEDLWKLERLATEV